MKLLLTILIASSIFVSCASHQSTQVSDTNSSSQQCTAPSYKGDMYNKSCALAVSKGELHVKGSDKYKVDHKGKIYYFKSEKSKQEFLKDIDKNTQSAHNYWVTGARQR
jgi:YHS domain-containing protein